MVLGNPEGKSKLPMKSQKAIVKMSRKDVDFIIVGKSRPVNNSKKSENRLKDAHIRANISISSNPVLILTIDK